MKFITKQNLDISNSRLVVADFHIHSPYSRAVSKKMTLENINLWCQKKGIKVIGTSDFTHPRWLIEIKEKLEPAEPGLYKLKGVVSEVRFILTTEISSIYSQGRKTRRIHNLIFAPDLSIVEKINSELIRRKCNLLSDGRPIVGLSSLEILKIVLEIDNNCILIPSHIWTPWFSVFGSMSGFNSIEECFGDYTKYIFAVETGLSSDPSANWRLSQLDKVALISNSDSHSLQKIGREANIFDTKLSYQGIIEAIKSGSPNQRKLVLNQYKSTFVATIEYFPQEGKYHYDGHRLCQVVFSPEETKKHNGVCPECEKSLTIGVMNRVEQLTDNHNIKIKNKGNFHSCDGYVPYYNLVSFDKIIAEAFGVRAESKKVQEEYEKFIKIFGNELKILLEIPIKEIYSINEKIAKGIDIMRKGELDIKPGYDGEYGKISIFSGKGMTKIEK